MYLSVKTSAILLVKTPVYWKDFIDYKNAHQIIDLNTFR